MSDRIWRASMILVAVLCAVLYLRMTHPDSRGSWVFANVDPADRHTNSPSDPSTWKLQHYHDWAEQFQDADGQWWECEHRVTDWNTGAYEVKCRSIPPVVST